MREVLRSCCRRGVVGVVLVGVLACRTRTHDTSLTTVPRDTGRTPLDAVGRAIQLEGLPAFGSDTITNVTPGPGGSLVLVVDGADCFTCLAIEAEAWEDYRLARDHAMNFSIVFEGPDSEQVSQFLSRQRMPTVPLLDRTGRVSRLLGPHPHPLVIWISASGRLVTMIPRRIESAPDAVRQVLGAPGLVRVRVNSLRAR